MVDAGDITRAAEAIDEGELVVYPTETVYGLGADALDRDAVGRVFEAKGRDRDEPVSMAVSRVDVISEYALPTERELAFCREFLPGPVTVVLEAREAVPRELTGGRDRVGVRVPDHEVALSLCERAGPVTATSANVTGRPSTTSATALDAEIRESVAVVLDGGETPGGGSTVVDVSAGDVLREGALAEDVASWVARRDPPG